ncbi:hypothetical protein HELRODRAFT_163158 [Helobdella robusta]|uniref:Thyroglobulin type-1 domain-containing protein n=1 Tax=Helobdella robusta TaxID=6412 RepID=T1ETQ9_HELRO|nr:hypothetical protein HELRODRAFT_163158 [Helobdella robusta]ESN96128.1 hypothetical protein HELRODRAFT_163158 [Helobdella robusta]
MDIGNINNSNNNNYDIYNNNNNNNNCINNYNGMCCCSFDERHLPCSNCPDDNNFIVNNDSNNNINNNNNNNTNLYLINNKLQADCYPNEIRLKLSSPGYEIIKQQQQQQFCQQNYPQQLLPQPQQQLLLPQQPQQQQYHENDCVTCYMHSHQSITSPSSLIPQNFSRKVSDNKEKSKILSTFIDPTGTTRNEYWTENERSETVDSAPIGLWCSYKEEKTGKFIGLSLSSSPTSSVDSYLRRHHSNPNRVDNCDLCSPGTSSNPNSDKYWNRPNKDRERINKPKANKLRIDMKYLIKARRNNGKITNRDSDFESLDSFLNRKSNYSVESSDNLINNNTLTADKLSSKSLKFGIKPKKNKNIHLNNIDKPNIRPNSKNRIPKIGSGFPTFDLFTVTTTDVSGVTTPDSHTITKKTVTTASHTHTNTKNINTNTTLNNFNSRNSTDNCVSIESVIKLYILVGIFLTSFCLVPSYIVFSSIHQYNNAGPWAIYHQANTNTTSKYSILRHPSSFSQSQKSCLDLGSHLVHVNSLREQLFLEELIIDYLANEAIIFTSTSPKTDMTSSSSSSNNNNDNNNFNGNYENHNNQWTWGFWLGAQKVKDASEFSDCVGESIDNKVISRIKTNEKISKHLEDDEYEEGDDDEDGGGGGNTDVRRLQMEKLEDLIVQTTKKPPLNQRQNLVTFTKISKYQAKKVGMGASYDKKMTGGSEGSSQEVQTKSVTYHHYAEEPPTTRSWYQRQIWKLVKYSTPPAIFDYELNDTFYDDRLSEPLSRLSRKPRNEVIWEEPVFKTGNCYLAALLSGSLANFSPSCTKGGFYTSKQCFMERCWCVTHFGQPIKKIYKNGQKVGWAMLHWTPGPENNMDESFFSYGYKAVKIDCDEILEEYRQEYLAKINKESEMFGDFFYSVLIYKKSTRPQQGWAIYDPQAFFAKEKVVSQKLWSKKELQICC